MKPTTKILIGDVRQQLRTLPAGSVHCCVTSPPYWGLRAYGTDPQVWGGAEGCEHEWGDELVGNKRGHPGDKSTLCGTQTAELSKAATINGAFCQKCQAWRGELGSEPTPEQFCRNMVEVFRELRRVLRDDGTLWLNMGDSYNGIGGPGKQNGGPIGPTAAVAIEGTRGRRLPGLKMKDLCGIPFDWQTFHSGQKARKNGWRWFCRISRNTDRCQQITNEIRQQVQVYLEFPMEGW